MNKCDNDKKTPNYITFYFVYHKDSDSVFTSSSASMICMQVPKNSLQAQLPSFLCWFKFSLS